MLRVKSLCVWRAKVNTHWHTTRKLLRALCLTFMLERAIRLRRAVPKFWLSQPIFLNERLGCRAVHCIFYDIPCFIGGAARGVHFIALSSLSTGPIGYARRHRNFEKYVGYFGVGNIP